MADYLEVFIFSFHKFQISANAFIFIICFKLVDYIYTHSASLKYSKVFLAVICVFVTFNFN